MYRQGQRLRKQALMLNKRDPWAVIRAQRRDGVSDAGALRRLFNGSHERDVAGLCT